MSLNFGRVFDQIGVKKKDPPVCPKILVWSRTNSGEKGRPSADVSHNVLDYMYAASAARWRRAAGRA